MCLPILPAPPAILFNYLLYLNFTLVSIYYVPSYCPFSHPYHFPSSPHPRSLDYPSPGFSRFPSSPELTSRLPYPRVPNPASPCFHPLHTPWSPLPSSPELTSRLPYLPGSKPSFSLFPSPLYSLVFPSLSSSRFLEWYVSTSESLS